jgi:Mg-chelatase subunit ChlD
MPRYIDVVHATQETAVKILALREGGKVAREVVVTTNGGATASVSWSDRAPLVTLNMPGLPPDAVLTRGEADRLVAFIVHECCHVLHTNKHAWERACQAGDRVRHWTNCLEDIRIEAVEIKAGVFPALKSLLGTMSNHLFLEALPKAASMGVTIGHRISDAPYVASVLGRVANGYAIPATHTLAADMSRDVKALVDRALTGVRRCQSTDAVRRLALELVRMEQAQAQAQAQAQEGQNGQGTPGEAQEGQDGQGTPGEAQEGQDGQGTPDEAQEGQDGQGTPGEAQEGQDGQGTPGEAQEGQDGQGTPGEAQEGQDGAPGKNPGDGPPIVSGDTPDMTETLAKIAARAGIDDLRRHARTNEGHRLITAQNVIRPGDASAYPASAQSAIANRMHANDLTARLPRNSVLHGQIGRLLVSEEVHRKTHHETSGRLDRRALVRMRAGALDVFSQRDDTPGMDTALLVLIDGSSSMRTDVTLGVSRMAIAQTAAWHIARAAEAANAKVAVVAFHTRFDQLNRRTHDNPTGAALTVVKPFTTPMDGCAAALGSVTPNAYTPLAPAILGAAGMLAEVNATRHILMVLTDGECDYGNDAVTAACALAEDMGVETVGVGMACDEVTRAFPPRYSVNVTDLGQLASTGLGVLVAMLEDANPRGGGND